EDGNLDGNIDTIVGEGNVEDESHDIPKSIEEVVEENESSSVPGIVDEPSQIDQPIEIELPKEVINVPKELPKEEINENVPSVETIAVMGEVEEMDDEEGLFDA